MHKRLLIIWLIISIFGYGSAWAFTGHVGEVLGHPAISSEQGHLPDQDHSFCDHYCHAAAHTLGLPCLSANPVYPGVDIGHTPYQYFFSCHLAAPPKRPPQV